MELRKVRDESEARAAMSAVAASGLPRRAWARQHGISPRSLNAWRLNLARRERGATPSLRVVEVTPLPASASSSIYAVHIADVRIELDDTFREDTLQRLLRVLRTC
jgi:transposase-like protein